MNTNTYIVAAAAIALFAVGNVTTRRFDDHYTARLNGANERPIPVDAIAYGMADITIADNSIRYTITVNGLDSPATMAHIHGPAGPSQAAGVLIPLEPITQGVTNGTVISGMVEEARIKIPLDSLRHLFRDGLIYVNVHTSGHPDGAIRGQMVPTP